MEGTFLLKWITENNIDLSYEGCNIRELEGNLLLVEPSVWFDNYFPTFDYTNCNIIHPHIIKLQNCNIEVDYIPSALQNIWETCNVSNQTVLWDEWMSNVFNKFDSNISNVITSNTYDYISYTKLFENMELSNLNQSNLIEPILYSLKQHYDYDYTISDFAQLYAYPEYVPPISIQDIIVCCKNTLKRCCDIKVIKNQQISNENVVTIQNWYKIKCIENDHTNIFSSTIDIDKTDSNILNNKSLLKDMLWSNVCGDIYEYANDMKCCSNLSPFEYIPTDEFHNNDYGITLQSFNEDYQTTVTRITTNSDINPVDWFITFRISEKATNTIIKIFKNIAVNIDMSVSKHDMFDIVKKAFNYTQYSIVIAINEYINKEFYDI